MLIATPKSVWSQHYQVTSATGEPIAELDLSMLKEGARLHYQGKVYRIERESLMRGPWLLLDGDTPVFEANKPSLMRNRFLVMVKGASLELAPKTWMMRRFGVVGPDWVDLGEIRRPSWFRRKVEIDLSDLVPEQAQLFLLFLAVVIWRRADVAAAS
ncbi:MAG: hypothetical protein DHS20C15_26710 [Planctomycetota bacterium]|nr:MAG: hypothetical protein DHS20C15_26710 [Planctomycetota bacterium]